MLPEIGRQLAVAGGLLPPEIFRANAQVLARHSVAFHLTVGQHPSAAFVVGLVREVGQIDQILADHQPAKATDVALDLHVLLADPQQVVRVEAP